LYYLQGCNDEAAQRSQVVSKLKNAAKLATVEYVVTKVISAKKEHWFLRDAHFFAETEAFIKAGIDFDKIREKDIVIQNKKISITLPPVEIISINYPANGFKVVEKYTDKNSLLGWNRIKLEERDELFRKAQQDIQKNVEFMGIVKTAEKNTILFLTKLLKVSGYEEIYIEFRKGDNTKNIETPNAVDKKKEK
jgi:hypothetical protein